MGSVGRGYVVQEFHAFKVTVGGDSGLIFAVGDAWSELWSALCVVAFACTLEINWSHFNPKKRDHIVHFDPDFHRLAIVSFFSLSSSCLSRPGEAYPKLTCNNRRHDPLQVIPHR